MRYVRILLPALVATALIVGAGCGGGDDNGGSDQLSKDEYAQKLKDTLEPLGTELQGIGDQVRQAGSAQELADSVKSAEDQIQRSIDELKSIQPPSEAESANDALVSALDTFNAALKKLSDAAASDNTAEILAPPASCRPLFRLCSRSWTTSRSSSKTPGSTSAGSARLSRGLGRGYPCPARPGASSNRLQRSHGRSHRDVPGDDRRAEGHRRDGPPVRRQARSSPTPRSTTTRTSSPSRSSSR